MDPDQPADLDIQFLKQDISRLSMVMVKYSWNIYKDNEQSYVIFYMSRAMSCLVLCRISASPGTPPVRWSTEWNFILNSKMVFHHPIYTV